jgi:integrase/recombinase XerD
MLRQIIDRYLEVRRTAGFELKGVASLLCSFARFAVERSETCVRQQTAIDWAAEAHRLANGNVASERKLH